MAKPEFTSVDDYIATLPEDVQASLQSIRRAIRDVVPDAEEAISYQMPTYKLAGRPVIYFAAWKQHYSIYPATEDLMTALKDELSPYTVEKGTIRFPRSQPVPVALIERIAAFRAEEVVALAAAKPPRRRG